MDTLSQTLKWLTRIVRISALFGAIANAASTAILWSQADFVRSLANAISGLPDNMVVVDARAQWLGFFASLPLVAVWNFGLWQLWRLFGLYESGRIFAPGTQKHLTRVAWALFVATLLTPVQASVLSIVLSLGMPPGQHRLEVHVSSDLLVSLLGSVVFLVIAQVLSAASRVADRSRELEVAGAAKTRFLAAASHDLRQPVVSINLLSELLQEQRLPATAVPILARLRDSVQALNQLLKGLMDLSRFEAGTVHVHNSRVALQPLLVRTIGDEAEAARRKGIRLHVRCGPFAVDSDPLLLEQILRNLVGNAVRYTQRGGVLVCARRRGSARVLLQVWDTGPGIPPRSQALVFEEFVQLNQGEQEGAGGLGLGLSLVRRAAGILGAPLALQSVVGRGSCFSIELPFAGVESPTSGASAAPRPGLDGLHVWVVEDDPGVRDALCQRLVGWGASVRDFSTVAWVRQALADAGPARPDLLLSDQRLPDGTGIEVAGLLRTGAPSMPVLIMTGDTAPSDLALLHSSGLPVLHKPFTSEGLLDSIQLLGVRPAARVNPANRRPE